MDWLGIGLGILDQVGNQVNSAVEYGRTKKLMDIQQQNQMELNRQGQQIQMETWRNTNYPAQMQMLKEAGLNPGLMYAKGGPGGTTGGQGGGSAMGGSAPRMIPMDLANIIMLNKAKAETENVKADTGVKQAQKDVIETTATREAESRINKAIAETDNEKLKGELIKVQTITEQIRASKSEEQINAQIDNLRTATKSANLHNQLTEATMNSIITETAEKAIGAHLENELTRSKTSLTDAERQATITGIAQKFTELQQRTRSLDQKDKEIAIQGFEKEINAEYPNVMNVIGKGGKTLVKMLENLASALKGGDPIPRKDEININAVNTR